MKTNDSVGAMVFAFGVPILFLAIIVIPASRAVFLDATAAAPYPMGFVKFALLSTVGDVVAAKLSGRGFNFPKAVLPKAIVWGVIGMLIVLYFAIIPAGVASAQAGGYLPGSGIYVIQALLSSILLNITFGIAMMASHRVSDTFLDMRADHVMVDGHKATVKDALKTVNWHGFVDFVVLKTLPFFWIPAHFITFLLPLGFRTIWSAMLSILLGVFLVLGRRK
ncbi:MAG: hypothetical protein LBR77_00465 [Lachnospiraceae bacterium]|jgi:hypothetical protein|nr:hypothetical protein [Lachnospiraceae bacterium]